MTTAKHRSRKTRATRAAAKGIPAADIQVEEGDADTAPYGPGTYVSRSTPAAGVAAAVAARKIQDKARKIAAHLLGCAPEDLVWEPGKFSVKGAPDRAKTIQDIAFAAYTTVERKATTFRLDPGLHVGLAVLGQVLKKPLNRLVNEAVQGFIEKRSVEVEADLARTLERLKGCRAKDPGFEWAIAQFVEAEASLGRDDPMEGRPRPAAGPAQTMVHELLRG